MPNAAFIAAFGTNGKKITDTYDIIGRITKRRLGLSSAYDTDITYIAGANGSKTALVSTYKNGSDAAYTYTYDANGNITSITKGSQSFSYTYDAANQLIRENLYYGAGNSNNATYTYTYDQWGNLTQRKKHTYTAPENQATMGTIYGAYGYANSAWGDQLTSYNMQTISYDSMGNPISYLGATLSWNGKQLTGYSKGGTNVTYAYNEDGLRTQKTYNGTTTDYYYNGSVLIGMQSGNTVQRFSYDAQGNVVAVDYSDNGGSSYTTYYYILNAQGDIVKLIDGNCNTVVEYTYDSWGKVLAVTGSLATSLGRNQPFRYRGYVYDTETGWYYLQSRYYDPTTCRFISSDVYLSTGQGVIGHNSYAYCLNNPLIFEDQGGAAAHFNTTVAVCDGGCNSKPRQPKSWEELNSGLAYYGINEKTGYFSNIDDAVISWSKTNVPITQVDHRERGGIIMAKTFGDEIMYKVDFAIPGNNNTCLNAFLFEFLIHSKLLRLDGSCYVVGFVHIHTAYPPDEKSPDWDYTDYGPSPEDYFLFNFPMIKRQFLANELGGVYEFYVTGPHRRIWGAPNSIPER